jgi:hypothetical protein
VSRRKHGAKVHDEHEEHRISHHLQARQKTNNVRTRSTTKTTRKHARVVFDNLDVPERSFGRGWGFAKDFPCEGFFSRDLHLQHAGTNGLQVVE